jgi:hypothetical protein
MGKDSQVFALQLQADTDQVWPALKRAIDDMDGAKLGSVNDDERELSFSTGFTLTSWGEHMTAKVVPAGAAVSDVQVRGKPTGTFLTTKVGEQMHASTIERRLRRALDEQLHTTAG